MKGNYRYWTPLEDDLLNIGVDLFPHLGHREMARLLMKDYSHILCNRSEDAVEQRIGEFRKQRESVAN